MESDCLLRFWNMNLESKGRTTFVCLCGNIVMFKETHVASLLPETFFLEGLPIFAKPMQVAYFNLKSLFP